MVSVRTIGLVALACLLFGGWIYLTRPSYKYRLTVDVETPDGVKSASGVYAVHLSKEGGSLRLFRSIGVRGDALVVDLPHDRKLFVTLARGNNAQATDGAVYLAENAFANAGHKASFQEMGHLKGTVPVEGTLIPTLAAFANLNDPKTARIVAPDDLQSVFGGGYRLKGISLTLVPVGFYPFDIGGPFGEPVTRGIAHSLPWIGSFSSYLSGRAGCDPRQEPCLQAVHFRRG